jgi:glycosyltransferase involved in cell wall biosynthesis
VRIVQLNLAADPGLVDPEALLDRYQTLTGWSRALMRAGAVVHVVQRFSRDATIERDHVSYEFVREGGSGTAAPWSSFPRLLDATRRHEPQVVHVNGLMFPGMTKALRATLGRSRAIVLQDHSGALLERTVWPLARIRAARWSQAFLAADAVSFTAPELASRWRKDGLPPELPVLTLAEASTELTAVDYADSRRRTGIAGDPAILWVGRLNANKDPQTALSAMERVASRVPGAHLWMIVPPAAPQDDVRRRIDGSATLGPRVTIVGAVEHRHMPAYHSAADIFVSASRHEGSGYALIESMACGALPCVTDIPAFRSLTHGCGVLWRAGDVDACASALSSAARRVSPGERDAVRAVFARELSWDVLGNRTIAAYRNLLEAVVQQ